MPRFYISVLIASMMMPGWLWAQEQAQDTEQMSQSELQKLVLELQKQLKKQQELFEQQNQTIEDQSKAISGMKTQIDQLTMSTTGEAPGLSDDEIALQDRLKKVEEELAKPPDTPENVLTAGDFSGSIKIPGTGMASKFGGFVRLGTVYSVDPIGSSDRFVTGLIPVGEDSADALFNEGFVISAERSRLNWDLRLDSSLGQFRAFIESDFAGNAGGSDVLRLRHAYGQYNRFILGQTWSTLMDNAATPEDVDFEGLNAQIQVRQPELRWTKGLGKNRPFALAFEDPSPSITGGSGISRFPDTVARISKQRGWGHLQWGLILRNIAGVPVDESGQVITSDDKSALGWGLAFSGNVAIKKWDRRDNFKFQVSGGDGLGRYINDLGTVGGFDGAFDADGNLKTLPVFAGYVSFQHWWRDNPLGLFKAVRSTFIYGYVQVDDLDFLPDDFYRSTERASANWLWSPISQIDLGLEYLWGRRKNKDGELGAARQFQFVATFRF
jgi:hypothetical protein